MSKKAKAPAERYPSLLSLDADGIAQMERIEYCEFRIAGMVEIRIDAQGGDIDVCVRGRGLFWMGDAPTKRQALITALECSQKALQGALEAANAFCAIASTEVSSP